MRRALSLVVLSILLAGTSVYAQEPQGVKVKACLSAKGMSPKVVKATRKKVIEGLRQLGATVAVEPAIKTSGEDNCCYTKECLAKEAAGNNLDGLVDVSVMRFGPMVTITIRVFDAVAGKEIRQTKAKARARKFPASASFKKVFGKGLDQLKEQADKRRALAEKKAQERKKEAERKRREAERKRREAEANRVVYVDKTPVGVGVENDSVGEPDVLIEETHPQGPSSAWYWVGGGVTAAGVALVATGIYYLTGPLQTAMDERDQAYQDWIAATEPSEWERFEKEFHDKDSKARDANLIGWVGAGAGAALVVGGILVMVLVPDSSSGTEYSERTGPIAAPLACKGGGGVMMEWKW